jgi:hypothetical protein
MKAVATNIGRSAVGRTSVRHLVIAATAITLAVGLRLDAVDAAAGQQTDVTALEQAVAAAEREIQAVRDEDAIENLIGIYGYYLDKNQWDQLTSLFAEDGTLELGLRGVYVGKKRIRESLDLLGPQGPRDGRLSNHLQLQPVIHLAADGNSAKIRSRALLQTGDYGGKSDWGEGIYENEVVKEGGAWKFKTVHFMHTFGADYDKGWAKDARPSPPGASDKLPPDRPPTIVFDIYPKTFVPPFHYPNPVSGKP